MDAEQQNPETYENVNPRFVWELEHAHTKTVAKPTNRAGGERPAPDRVSGSAPGPRPRRRRTLLPVAVVVVVIAGGALGLTQIVGHGNVAGSDTTRAAEAGSAEFPQQADIPSAAVSSSSSQQPTAPPKRASKSPTRAGSAVPKPESTTSAGLTPAQATAPAAPVPAPTANSAAKTAGQPVAPATTAMPAVVESLSDQWGECALLNATCSVSQPSVVALGANGYFNYGTFGSATDCDYSVFGNPDATGQLACYSEPTPAASTDVWTECAAENGTCSYSGVMTIAFGANGDYHYATLGGGGTACTDAVFGDPDYDTVKACYLMAPPPQFTHWDLCATNGGTCKFSGTSEVAYGADGRYTYGSHSNGTSCTESTLGDPEASGTAYCYVQDYYQY